MSRWTAGRIEDEGVGLEVSDFCARLGLTTDVLGPSVHYLLVTGAERPGAGHVLSVFDSEHEARAAFVSIRCTERGAEAWGEVIEIASGDGARRVCWYGSPASAYFQTIEPKEPSTRMERTMRTILKCLSTEKAPSPRRRRLGSAMNMKRFVNRTAQGVGLFIALSLGLATCGNAKPSAVQSAFCNGLLAFDKVSTPGGPDEEPVAANKKFAIEVAEPLKTLMDNAPSKIRSDVASLDVAVKKAQSGDPAGGDEVGPAKPAIEAWAYDNCGFQKIDVRAEDYEYRGIPKTLDSGKTAIRFTNRGQELHIMLWLARKAGDTRPAPEVIGTAFASGTFEGFLNGEPAGAPPGQTGGATMNLPAGRYIIFCPVSVNDNEQDPHFAHGMVSEVIVS